MHLPILVALPLIITILLIIIVQELFFFGCRSSPSTLPPTTTSPTTTSPTTNQTIESVDHVLTIIHCNLPSKEVGDSFSVSQSVNQSLHPNPSSRWIVCWSVVSSPAGGSQYRQTCRIGSIFVYSSVIIINRQITRRSRSIISCVLDGGGWYRGILGMYLPLAI